MMNHGQFKELWEIRFQKILDGEKEALIFYKDLLTANAALFEGTGAKDILEQIKQDEARHTRIAHELLNLVQHKEISK